MNNRIGKSYGIAIIIGCVLMTITMVLHPVGGGIEHLLTITPLIIGTHLIAILSIPFMVYGFYGFTCFNGGALSTGAFTTFTLSMVAVLIAAAINGLALPFFVGGLDTSDVETIELSRLILSFNFSLNQAFDIIFIIFASAAVVLWSIDILRSRKFPVWIAVYGIASGTLAVTALGSGVILTHLAGFRVFMFGFILWIVIIGILLIRAAGKPNEGENVGNPEQ